MYLSGDLQTLSGIPLRIVIRVGDEGKRNAEAILRVLGIEADGVPFVRQLLEGGAEEDLPVRVMPKLLAERASDHVVVAHEIENVAAAIFRPVPEIERGRGSKGSAA